MADQIDISQEIIQTECQKPGNNLVSQCVIQTECQKPGNNLVSQFCVQVECVEVDIILPSVTQAEIDEAYYSGMGDFVFSGGSGEPQIWRY